VGITRQCPQCFEFYTTELEPKPEGDTRMIQDIYPDAEPYQTEQLMALGICSDRCFDRYISGERPEYTYDNHRFPRRFENGVRKLFADPPEDR
jgi:hypothetical protein